MKRKTIAVLQGGYTAEAAISYGTAGFVMSNLDRELFDPVLCTILEGKWEAHDGAHISPINKVEFSFQYKGLKVQPDMIFMAIHGTPGENGILQQYFEKLGIPVNTGDSENMSLTFNKARTTDRLRELGFEVASSIRLQKDERYDQVEITNRIGMPCFVKPNNGGSSLGISRVDQASDMARAVDKAFAEDDEIMIESFLEGTEVTCGVARMNGKVTALPVTEVISKNEFFDYDSKYTAGGNEEITPARIPQEVYEKCQRISEQIYEALNCMGIVRIDQMIMGGKCSIIEVNTVPGMSAASILPKQAEVAGIPAKELFTLTLQEFAP